MANSGLSSTLRNLKFMQRNTAKEDKAMEVEPCKPVADSDFPPARPRKYIVIVEGGEPHPGGTGCLSFGNFNPYIEKLNEERAKKNQNVPHASDNDGNSERGDDAASRLSSKGSRGGCQNISAADLKRKEADETADRTTSQKLRKDSKDDSGRSSGPNGCRAGSNKQQKHENLDWNVLRPPKPNKMG